MKGKKCLYINHEYISHNLLFLWTEYKEWNLFRTNFLGTEFELNCLTTDTRSFKAPNILQYTELNNSKRVKEDGPL